MNILEALKRPQEKMTSKEEVVILCYRLNWLEWHEESKTWIVKRSNRGGPKILLQTRDETEAVAALLETDKYPE